ncbi:alpha/beta hydrolase [Humibacter sp.]|uniref:alpha/beta hydrolase n=1 Tax=Humibacter sp. TaxID=1940291 RepID=UPI003F817E4E
MTAQDVYAIDIVSGPLIVIVMAVASALFLFLVIRFPTRRWLVTAAAAILAGIVVAVVIWFVVVRINHTFGIPLKHAVYLWFAATLAAVSLAVASMWRTRWWRKAAAGAAIPVFLIAGTMGINASIGLDRTLGSLIGVVVRHPLELAPAVADMADGRGGAKSPRPLWQTWMPPANMPKTGKTGTHIIPGTMSGFIGRPAGIYLPPAALVAHAPALPLVILMMGQPGSPDPTFAAAALNAFAARHKGLAPIVVVADQLGNSDQDPLCLNTTQFGNARTYITVDVVNWALTHLNVIKDHRYWTIAGYSNGGACAASFIAQQPQLWSNLIDVSGEEYPGL